MTQKPEIKTQDDLNSLIEFVNECKKVIYDENNTHIDTIIDKYIKYTWVKDVRKFFINKKLVDKGSLDEYLKNLSDSVEKVEKVVINMPFMPSDNFINKLYDYVKPLVKSDFIIDVKQDSTMSLGAKLFCSGTFIDLSLKPKIINLLSENVIGKKI